MEVAYSHSASRSSSTTCTASSGRSASYYLEPSSPILQEVARYMSELMGSYDTEKLCGACLGLAEVIKDADRDCLHLLSERDVVGVVIKMMEELPSHSSAQQAGCEVLLSCNEQIELRSSIEDRNAYRSVLSALKGHPNDPYLLGKAVHALASFSSTALSDSGLKESKAYSYVLKCLSENHFDVSIQTGGLKALASLLRTDPYAVSNIARQGKHRIIFDAIRTHATNADVVAYGFQTLQIIAGCDSGVGVLLELTDILVLLMEQLQKFSDNETVVAAASGLIEVLTAAEVEVESDTGTDITSTESGASRASSQLQFGDQVVQLGVLHLLTELLEKYTEVFEIQVHVFSSLEHICLLPEIKVSDTMLEQWLHLLSDAFANYGDETAMMEAGCRCLARLLELNPHLHTLIGADSSRYQIPLHNSVWITLLAQSNDPNPSVFRAVTMALFFLVVDDESLQKLLLDKGASEALLECLREYLHEVTRNDVCVECGCRALRGILMHQCSEDHKNYLVTIGIVRDLGRILDDFISEPDVISEAFCVIACLADMESFQKTVLQCSLCKQILEAVERHAGHDILVESALEVLILLSQNSGLIPLLHDVDVLGVTVAIMRKHVVSPSIQCKGCMLIRLLSGSKYLISKPLCTSIAKVVIDALARKTDHNVQTEALSCAYTLCECSAQMSEALVKGDIHLLLFTLLYREPVTMERVLSENSMLPRQFVNRTYRMDNSGQDEDDDANNFIFQLGTDIIYTLSCIRDFKQEMLTTAVQDGLLEGVKVLVEIGADVNSGEESDTPICLAVHSNNKEMVEYLLQNGVNNVHKALSHSREKKLDEITGLLLEHIGLDRNGDVVNLSGLELKKIKPTWILPSLGIKYSPRQTHHRRNRSLGKLNEVLKHRKSMDMGILKHSEHPPFSLPLTSRRPISVSGVESLTAASLFKTRFGSGGRLSRGSPPPSGMGNENVTDPTRENYWNATPSSRKTSDESRLKERKTYSGLSSLRQKLNSGYIRRRSRSSTPDKGSSSDSRVSSCSSDQESSKKSKKSRFRTKLRFGSKSPDPQDVQSETVTPTRSKTVQPLRVRRSGVQAIQDHISPNTLSDYEPVLSPIKGTPTHQGSKRSRRPLREETEEVDSGFENVATNQTNTNTTVVSPLDDASYQDRSESSLVEGTVTGHTTSKLNQRLHSTTLGRRGTITGVELSRLPFSHVDGYSSQASKHAYFKQGQSKSQEEFSISPSQLFRQLKKFRRSRRRHSSGMSSSSSSVFYTRLESPAPVVYTRNDNYCESEEAAPPIRATFEISESGSARDPSSLIVSSSDIQNSVTPSTSVPFNNGRVRERSPISDGSTQLLTPMTSVSNSRRSSIDVSFRRISSGSMALTARDSRDEIDFGGYFEKIPEVDEDVPATSVPNRLLIKALDLSSNMLTSLSDLYEEQGGGLVFNRLKGLRRLDLKQNQISQLPTEMMQELTNLTSLNLSCNVFTSFPKEAVLSQHLTSLDLSANKISSMSSLPVLPNLVRLNLSNNHLEHFPPTLTPDTSEASLPHLRFMNLQSNHILSVPNHNTRLKDLEELNISKNRIRDLPDQFLTSVTSLKSLNASRNELMHIAGEVAQDLVHLTSLKVANNNLGVSEVEFNNFVTSAPVLQSVDASENDLTSLPPPYAWRSRGLREIRMTSNKITRLDLSDGGKFWPHLESLYLGENKLREIPKEVGNLHSLSCLDVSHNKDIRHLPNEMGNLEYLFMLNLQGLKNLSLDPSLQNGSTKAIISYLKSRHTRSVPYYHMKLMIVGAAAKGKTTLLHQIMSEKPVQSPKGGFGERNMATLGVSVKQWSYQYKPGGHGSTVSYHIGCWDFAGQEEFYSTHQCFLSQRSLYVLVYNLAQGESELQYLLPWLLNVQARAPSSPVLIVGTHIDKLDPDEFERSRIMMRDKIREMLRRPGFPGDVSFGEVNCFDEKLVVNLRRKIKVLIDGAKLRGQKIMGGMVPSNYLALEELIQREKRRMERSKSDSRFPVLQASRLKEMMDASKLSQKMDKAETERAIQFLHECGVLLYYSDLQTKLSELYFLNPEWLCMLMAQIITIPEINPFINKDGLMKLKSLPFVLKEPRFPSEFLPEYIRLLERFEVALRQTPDTLLIPSHLPKMKPQEGIILPQATPGSLIVRRYLLCYIPPGFWPRLVARLITFPKLALRNYKSLIPTTLHVWSGGMYSYWNEQSYFLINLLPGDRNTFDIVVPTTNHGTKLLCSIVDNVEALIDEWFPGLRDLDILNGDSLVKPLSLCPFCTGTPHYFPLKQLMEVALTAEEVECPLHKGPVLLEQLAPDTVISDLESRYKVAPGEFVLEEITKNFLGKGGFGEVYKAEFRGQAVAVKVFSQKVAAINNTTPNHLIRQEVQILSQCQHPFVISMVAVTLRPKPMLFLEFAELGSLNSFYPYSNINLLLKHRIAFQVAGALEFLHKSNVIYRDLKPDNILIFSLSTIAKVNAKLSDYGIACYATESGLTQPMGTAGCKAPELLMANSSSMPYNDKVDIYSYGLTLFVMMTNGHKPFEELSAGYEIDKFIVEGRPINDIDHYGCPPWPDMQDLINHCLQYTPSNRPSAREIFDRLCNTEFVSLKRAIQVERDHTIEMFATRTFKDKYGTKNVEVWMASFLGTQTMLSIMNLSKKSASPQGMMMPPGTLVLSMVAIESALLLMGTSSGNLFVYDSYDRKLKHQLACVGDSVLCLVYFKSLNEQAYYVCAGLANGKLAFYDQYMLMIPNAHARVLEIGVGPVKSVKRYHGRLYACCGSDVVVIKISDLNVEYSWNVMEGFTKGFVTGVEVGQDLIWTTHSKSPKIQVWDMEDGKHRGTLHCDVIMSSTLPKDVAQDSIDTYVTSMHLQPPPYSILWIGLATGHLLIINASSRTPLMVTKRHVDAVRSIQSVKALVADKPVHLILTAGFGFRQRPGYKTTTRGTPESYGNLLVWDSIMPRLKQNYEDFKKQVAQYR